MVRALIVTNAPTISLSSSKARVVCRYGTYPLKNYSNPYYTLLHAHLTILQLVAHFTTATVHCRVIISTINFSQKLFLLSILFFTARIWPESTRDTRLCELHGLRYITHIVYFTFWGRFWHFGLLWVLNTYNSENSTFGIHYPTLLFFRAERAFIWSIYSSCKC